MKILVQTGLILSTAWFLNGMEPTRLVIPENSQKLDEMMKQVNKLRTDKEKTMKPFHKDIVALAKENTFFRREVATGHHAQVVLMSLNPRQDIGEEVHKVDQILVFVEGQGEAILDGKLSPVNLNDLVFVPAGTRHNFRNTGGTPLKLYSIYAPPVHKPGTVYETKSAAAYEELIEGT